MSKLFVSLSLLAASVAAPIFAQQNDIKSILLSRMKNSRDFTLKVAEAMPASDYGFKLTPQQMSFAGQMVHIGESFTYFLSAFSGEKPNPSKPANNSKADVIPFVKSSYDKAIDEISKLSPEQLSKSYKMGEGGSMNGTELLIAMLEHAAHHRASAEMYLRAKDIKPPSYQD